MEESCRQLVHRRLRLLQLLQTGVTLSTSVPAWNQLLQKKVNVNRLKRFKSNKDGNELTQEEEDGDKAGSGMDGEDKDREKTYKPSMDGEKAGTDEKKKEDGEKPGSGIDGKDENMKKTCTPSMDGSEKTGYDRKDENRPTEHKGGKPAHKHKKLTLTRDMARTLKNGDWLSDDHVYLAQELIRKQFPHVQGLQSTLLCQNNGFVPIQAEGYPNSSCWW